MKRNNIIAEVYIQSRVGLNKEIVIKLQKK